MIDPPPPAIINGSAARLSKNAPVRLISSTLCQSAAVSAMARQMPPPAPLIRAALPASRMSRLRFSQHHRAAIDGDGLSGDKPAVVGNQPHHRPDQIRWHQVALDRLAGLDRVQRTIELIPEKLGGALGDDRARSRGFDGIAVGAELAC